MNGNRKTAVNFFEVVKPTGNVRWKIRDSHLFCKSQYIWSLSLSLSLFICCGIMQETKSTVKHLRVNISIHLFGLLFLPLSLSFCTYVCMYVFMYAYICPTYAHMHADMSIQPHLVRDVGFHHA